MAETRRATMTDTMADSRPTEKELLLDIIRRVRDELLTPMDLFKRQRWIAETGYWLTGVLVKYELLEEQCG
jgi:hypothetical protein